MKIQPSSLAHSAIFRPLIQPSLGLAVVVWLALALLALPAGAQTVTISPQTQTYWAGMNTSNVLGVGSNSVVITGANGTTVNLAVNGQPGGVTPVLSTNACTNNIQLGLTLNATNVVAGTYHLNLNATGAASYSTNVNLFVVPQWIQTNKTIGNWFEATGTNWSSGAAPGSGDAVYFEHMVAAPYTNVVDSSRTIQSLVYLGDADDAGYANALNTTINGGQTLSVLGTNGFYIGRKNQTGARPFFTFNGAGTLVVTNAAANFGVIDGDANSTRYLTVNMTNLNNLNAYVNRFAVGDTSLSKLQGVYYGAQMVNFYLAKTNIITALFADNYTNVDFNTSVQYERSDVGMNGAQTAGFNLGLTNVINADSVGIGRGGNVGSGSTAFGILGYSLKFANVFSNSAAPFAGAVFRNTNGGRMSLLALGVDSGTAVSIGNNRGMADFRGGRVDMQVDQIWLGQNRTNCAAKDDQGGLYFDWGNVNANTLVAGNMKYTNAVSAIVGYVLVGTNGTLNVNSNLALGLTPANVSGFGAQAAAVSGQVQINNGGVLRANQITVGQFSTNNFITINNGGTLDVTNTVASASTMLTALTAAGGGLTLHIKGNNTSVFVSNLTASASSPINIASVSGISSYPVTIHVISYASATTPNNWVGGTGPAGLSVGVANNAANNSIDLTLSTGTPKTLLWQGYVDNTWNSSTPNWLDLNTGLHTNFATLDKVVFDDTATVTSLTVTEDVVPSQTLAGILITNNLAAYTFTGSGRILGGASVTKSGTNSLTVDLYTEFGVNLTQGALAVTSAGTIGSAAISAGATFANAGMLLGGITCAGVVANTGTVSGALTVQTSGVATNTATINGALTLQTGSLLYNAGTFYGIGSATVATNSTLINAGTLYGSSLTVSGTLVDLVANGTGSSPGSINVGTLSVNGTFQPGGNSIATTKVTDYAADGSTQQGNPSGRVQLNAGSTTIFQVNMTNSQPFTKLLSQNQGFGPSQANKGINGCTLLITNVGATQFSAGQTFKLFGQYYNDGNINNAGANTTNSYPLIIPKSPGPGLAWDLSQLIPGGTIGVISASSVQINLTSTFTLSGTNIITELSWPADYIGAGWLQQQVANLANGLGTNWTTVGASTTVNDIFITNVINGNSAVFYRFVRP